MSRKLPPLNPLRAFEAAARTLSFTKAADELFITQAAISHQIKMLEDVIGIKLFKRLNRAIILTEEGMIFLPHVRDALDTLATGMGKLSDNETTGTLTVSVMPSFAATWLVPRLIGFKQICPDIDLRISASFGLVDFNRDNIDVALRWGGGNYTGLISQHFMTEDVFPVCSPDLLKNSKYPLDTPADLKYFPLIHDEMGADWRMWLLAANIKGINLDKGMCLNQSDLVIQTAIAGHGIALGRSSIARAALLSGQLIKPFDLVISSKCAFYIVAPEANFNKPKVKSFRQWIMAEVENDKSQKFGNHIKVKR